MNTNPLISIILPVYNVKDYLDRCIQSVISQTYSNLQIIIVDDGSTDGGGELCDAYKEKDSRIQVIHKPNGGVSSARNAGLRAAKGEYIAFIDSDDYIADNMYEKLYDAIKNTDADYAECGYCFVYDDGTVKNVNERFIDFSKPFYTQEELLELCDNHQSVSRYQYIWNKLFARHVWDGIEYNEQLHFMENAVLSYKLKFNVKRVALIPDILYMYYQRKNSASHSSAYKYVYDIAYAHTDVANDCLSHNRTQSGIYHAMVSGGLLLIGAEEFPLNTAENKARFNNALKTFRVFYKKYFAKLFFSYANWLIFMYLFPHTMTRLIVFCDKKFLGGKVYASLDYRPDDEKNL